MHLILYDKNSMYQICISLLHKLDNIQYIKIRLRQLQNCHLHHIIQKA